MSMTIPEMRQAITWGDRPRSPKLHKEILATLDRVEVLEKALTDIMVALSARNFDNMAKMIKEILETKGTR